MEYTRTIWHHWPVIWMFRTHFTHNFSFHKTTTYSQQLERIEQPARTLVVSLDWIPHSYHVYFAISFTLCILHAFSLAWALGESETKRQREEKTGACFNYQQTQLMANMEQNRKTCPTVKNIGKNHIRTYDSNYPAIVSYFNRWSNAFCLSHRKH